MNGHMKMGDAEEDNAIKSITSWIGSTLVLKESPAPTLKSNNNSELNHTAEATTLGEVVDQYYFDSYARFSIHQTMLKDYVRTDTYRRSIVENKVLFEGRVVLDIGCGTGILSMFAASAGAKHVIGIDCSGIADFAVRIVRANRLEDTINIVKAKVEELDELPRGVEKVDIIVSEWMGYCLFYESMLETVLHARDKWLKPHGLIFPNKCSLFITAIQDRLYKEERINYWSKVRGFNLSCIGKIAAQTPYIDTIDEESVITNNCLIVEANLSKMTKDDLEFTRDFHLYCSKDDYIHGFATFFTAEFGYNPHPTWFSTAPEAPYTHWKQTIFYFKEEVAVKMGEEIRGSFSLKQLPEFNRNLEITISVDFDGEVGSLHEVNKYRMF